MATGRDPFLHLSKFTHLAFRDPFGGSKSRSQLSIHPLEHVVDVAVTNDIEIDIELNDIEIKQQGPPILFLKKK